jgi:serine/threonine protein kinase
MPIAAGTRIGPYEIVDWLGAGGMGEVYRARDPRPGREVALKLIPQTFATDASRVNRFEQEARAAGQLNHPNILAVHDVGIHDGAPYIVSELLEGESIRSRLRGGPLPPRKAVDYARQIAVGLAAAHDKGITHRDVKPDNLFITSDGRLKILDFGIAKLTKPSSDSARHTGLPTETAEGMVVGTAGYMSPEQVRGEAVDARSDIFSVGTVLHEMLTGRPPFARETAAETMAAVLNEDPPDSLPASVSPALARIVSRCLEKTREMRFQSARDLAFGLEVLSDTANTTMRASHNRPPRWRLPLGIAVVVLSLLIAAEGWRTRSGPLRVENPLADARFSRFTDWDGTESGAQISPDGRFVAFIADRDGEFDLWVSQVGTGRFQNLTREIPPLSPPGVVLRSFGFTGDGADIWFSTSGEPGAAKVLMPFMGGTPRPFLAAGDATPAWSHDGRRLAYFNNVDGDPIFVADRTGADPRRIFGDSKGMHNHNLAWAADGEWIYFVHGPVPTVDMDVWRIQQSGGPPERLTDLHAAVNYLAPIDARTLLYVARAEDRSGPWLWALDVPTKVVRRVNSGLEQYTSVSASNDGRRVVTTVARPMVSLSRVPIGTTLAEDADVESYRSPTEGAVAPRFGGTSMFYLSARGTADGLWRLQDGQSSEIWKNIDGPLTEPVAVSKDGNRIAVVVRQ